MVPMLVPETHYARAGDLRIAYQQWGEGPPLVFIPALISNIEISWEHELYRRNFEHFGRHMTCVQFDKRGIGLSDRFDGVPTMEQRNEDIFAVMDAVGWDRAHFLGVSEGAAMAQLFAADFPERVESLALVNTFVSPQYRHRYPDYVQDGDAPLLGVDGIIERFMHIASLWSEDPRPMVEWEMPSAVDNESFIRWVGRLQRMSCSPKDFVKQLESVVALDAGDAPERITTRTLVMHVKGDRVLPVAGGRLLAELIPDATYVEVSGEDHFAWIMPSWRELDDILIEFATGTAVARASTRRFATVLFTDIVGSTRQSAERGDAAWRAILDSHDRIARGLIDEHGGRVVKSTGDGLLVTFDAPSQGVACSVSLRDRLAGIGVEIRAGVHAGEIELHDDGDVSGIAVNLAARVEQRAGDGEIWASSTVRDLMLGGSTAFSDAGEHELKGIDGSWRLFSIAAS
jgi:class 3 adenylate cyclase